MTDERILKKDCEVEGVTYELWCDRYGNWFLVFGGYDQDLDQFTEAQISRISKDVQEMRAP